MIFILLTFSELVSILSNDDSQTAHIAHFSGFISGLILFYCFVSLKWQQNNLSNGNKKLQIFLVLFLLFFFLLGIYKIQYSEYIFDFNDLDSYDFETTHFDSFSTNVIENHLQKSFVRSDDTYTFLNSFKKINVKFL